MRIRFTTCCGPFISLAFLAVFSTLVSAQTRHVLTLEQSIDIALGRSNNAKQLEQNLISSRMSLRAARLSFKSNAQFDVLSLPNFEQSERPTNVQGGGISFDRQETLNFAAQVSVNQPVSFTDGTFSLVSSMSRFRFRTFGEFEQTDISFRPDFRVQYSQPLFTLNRLKTGLKRAELNLESTLQTYTRSQLDLVFNVTANFYSLFQAQQQAQIDNEQVTQSENAYRIANLKQQAGLLPEVEVLRLEVDLANARNTAATSEANLLQSEDAFKNLIGLSITDIVEATTDLEYTPVEVTLEKALGEALDRRTELRSDEISVELDRISVKETDTNREVSGQIFLSYGLSNREERFSDAFQNFDNDRSVRVSLSIPLWDWGRNAAEVQSAKANLESSILTKQNRVNLITEEIRTAVRNLASAQTRVEINKRSQELAEKSYRISLLRFENGDISSQDLALEQTRLTQSRTNYLASVIDYKRTLADLRRKTLWDFERSAPVVVEVPDE